LTNLIPDVLPDLIKESLIKITKNQVILFNTCNSRIEDFDKLEDLLEDFDKIT